MLSINSALVHPYAVHPPEQRPSATLLLLMQRLTITNRCKLGFSGVSFGISIKQDTLVFITRSCTHVVDLDACIVGEVLHQLVPLALVAAAQATLFLLDKQQNTTRQGDLGYLRTCLLTAPQPSS